MREFHSVKLKSKKKVQNKQIIWFLDFLVNSVSIYTVFYNLFSWGRQFCVLSSVLWFQAAWHIYKTSWRKGLEKKSAQCNMMTEYEIYKSRLLEEKKTPIKF